MQQRSEYTFSLVREAIGYPIPSLAPSPISEPEKSRILDVNAVDLKLQGKTGKRVAFNEIVVLYREVEEELEYLDDEMECFGGCGVEFGDID